MIDVWQYYECAFDSEYTRVLNMLGSQMILNKILHNRYLAGFGICLEFWIIQLHHRSLTGFWIFLRFWIYQDSKYAKVTQDCWQMLHIDAWQDSEYSLGSKYGRVLNMSGLHKVLNKTHHYRYLIVSWICL